MIACAGTTVTLPTRSETEIMVKLSRRKDGEEVLLEPVPELAKLHLAAARCLVKVTNGKAVLRLSNPTNQAIELREDLVLANSSDVQIDDFSPLTDNHGNESMGGVRYRGIQSREQ